MSKKTDISKKKSMYWSGVEITPPQPGDRFVVARTTKPKTMRKMTAEGWDVIDTEGGRWGKAKRWTLRRALTEAEIADR